MSSPRMKAVYGATRNTHSPAPTHDVCFVMRHATACAIAVNSMGGD
jgi:hypothetical protein